MKPQNQVSAKEQARHCRELGAVLATPDERAFAFNIARAFDRLAKEVEPSLSQASSALGDSRGLPFADRSPLRRNE